MSPCVGVWCVLCGVWCAQQVNKIEVTADKHFLAAAGNPHIKLFEVNSNQPQPVSRHVIHCKVVALHCTVKFH